MSNGVKSVLFAYFQMFIFVLSHILQNRHVKTVKSGLGGGRFRSPKTKKRRRRAPRGRQTEGACESGEGASPRGPGRTPCGAVAKANKGPKEGPPPKKKKGHWKTVLCINWQHGSCQQGPQCSFAHGDKELRHADRQAQLDPEQAASSDVSGGPLGTSAAVSVKPRAAHHHQAQSSSSSPW